MPTQAASESSTAQPPLDIVAIRLQAIFLFLRHQELGTRLPYWLADPAQVGILARDWAYVLFLDEDDGPRFRAIAEVSGYLVNAISACGMRREDVLELADHAVATVVARLTPDHRSYAGRRTEELITRIGDTTHELAPIAQLIKFCEIDILIESVIDDWPTDVKPASTRTYPIKTWAEELAAVLRACTWIASRPEMQDAYKALHARISHVERMAARLTRRSPEKAAEIAAKEAVTVQPEPTPSIDPRGRRRSARRRSYVPAYPSPSPSPSCMP